MAWPSSSLRVTAAILLAASGFAVAPALAANGADPALGCETAGAAAEARYGLPDGLLRAIGRVESGRRNPATGRVAAWPWTINAQGRGQLFDTQEQAVAAVQSLQRGGVGSIDVGCFQVNLAYHPTAFPALQDGFDPDRNADYAARFLVSLQARTGSWPAAVAAYHSALPERGEPYRDRVLATWGGTGVAGTPVAARPVAPAVMRVVTWRPTGGAMRVWTPSAPGQGASIIRIGLPSPKG